MTKLRVRQVEGYESQHIVENDGHFDDFNYNFFHISGFFGGHGPHVVAASPELFVALKSVLNEVSSDILVESGVYHIITAAIAKAEGKA